MNQTKKQSKVVIRPRQPRPILIAVHL